MSGHAYRIRGAEAAISTLEGRLDVDTLADAATNYLRMVRLFQGRLVAVTDDLGKTYNGVMCLKIERVESFALLKAVGGISASSGAFLVVRFTLQCTRLVE